MTKRLPGVSALALSLAFAGVAQSQIPALTCGATLEFSSALSDINATYARVESGSTEADCTVSSYATDVYYEQWPVQADTAGYLLATFCDGGGANFDTFLSIYEAPDGSPGAFDPLDPCTHLLAANDDACSLLSEVGARLPAAGEVTFVVSSFANGQSGTYTFNVSLACPAPIIPTLDGWGYAILGGLLLLAGWSVLRRRAA